jgi:hypothetical protein
VAAILWLGIRVARRRDHRRLVVVLSIAFGVSLIAPMVFASTLLLAKGWPGLLAFIIPLAMASKLFNEATASGTKEAPAPAETRAPVPATAEAQLPPPWEAS